MMRSRCAVPSLRLLATLAIAIAALPLAGCITDLLNLANPDLAAGAYDPAASKLLSDDALALEGELSGAADVRFFDLAPAAAGESWTVSGDVQVAIGSALLVALFDADLNLLAQVRVQRSIARTFVIPRDTPMLRLGVAATTDSGGGFRLRAGASAPAPPPGPRPQLIWLNFAGGEDVRVAGNAGISFGPFDAAELGAAYAGQTHTVKSTIVDVVREHYAPYDVEIVTSDESPPPAAPHCVVHFGGEHPALLGLADRVDENNSDPQDTAVVFVRTFARYSVMQLSPEQFGRMIANSASHELGHLLGLHHTAGPANLMDTTASAWDLVGPRVFSRERLEGRVFPAGYEHSPLRLEDIVGPRPGYVPPAEGATAKLDPSAMILRELIPAPPVHLCGNCDDQ
jgi:hypothetical protein